MVLGPVSIDKDYQNMGFGTELIEYTLNLAKTENIPFIFVIGDENYYCRFGFVSASKYNIFLENTDTGKENPFFMIKIFDKMKLKRNATFHNPKIFDVENKDVDEFDLKFEYKEKLVLKGQVEDIQ